MVFLQTVRTVSKSVQAWMYETDYYDKKVYEPDNCTVRFPKAVKLSKRIEKVRES